MSTRDRMLDAAAHVMHTRGLSRATTKEIAKAAGYSEAALYKALSSTTLDAAPGTRFVYSDFGYGLLGLAMARRARMDFESLVISRVCDPLGMDSTRMALTPALQRRVAPGHDQKRAPVISWNLPPAFAAAGAFRSTANDLLRFLADGSADPLSDRYDL